MKKLLLIYPSIANNPEIHKPIPLLSGIAKRRSWKVEYFDTYIYEKSKITMDQRLGSGEFKLVSFEGIQLRPQAELIPDLQNLIDFFAPDIIAISCNSYEYNYLIAFLSEITINRKTKVIIGGVHCVLKPDEVINSGLFDLVCIGDGEEVFEEILTKLEHNTDLQYVKNTFFMDKITGKAVKNPRDNLIDENVLWTFPLDFSLFGDEYFNYPFHGKMYKRFRIELGRGCPYDCNYCANSALKKAYKGCGKYYRTRPLETIKSDMMLILDKYGIELFLLDDECLLAHSKKWLNEFFSWYGKEIKKPFTFQTRPETVTEEKMKILKKSNAPFFQAKMGVESGSERILKDICNRTTKIKQIIRAFEILRKHKDKVLSSACFMMGFPFETREDIFKTINLCREIRPGEIIVSTFQPMPGQKLRKTCVDAGFMKEDDIPDFFSGRSILRMPQITADEIEGLKRVFTLYATLPSQYHEEIELCEKDYENNKNLHEKLLALRWSLNQ